MRTSHVHWVTRSRISTLTGDALPFSLLLPIMPANADLSNWTARDSARAWQTVTSSADGTKLVAVVDDGRIYAANAAVLATNTPAKGVVPGKGTLNVTKLSVNKYLLTVSSTAPKTKFAITATKKGSKTLTYTGTSDKSGGITINANQNLADLEFALKLK